MVYNPSNALAANLSLFVETLSEADVDKAMAQMANFTAVDEEQLEEWVDSEGREVALIRALMAIARDKLSAEGTKISMMQYLWYKQRSLESGMIKSAEFDEIERELLADGGSPDSHDFLCEVWSAAFVKRMRQQLLGKGGTYH